MTLMDTLRADFDAINKKLQYDEQWVVAEFTKGWQLLQTAEQTVELDIINIAKWIQAHQSSIVSTLNIALTAAAALGTVAPASMPAITAATAAINVGTALVNKLTAQIVAGGVTFSTAVDAYHAVKDAQSAVNTALKIATTKPATVNVAAAQATIAVTT